MGKVKNVFIKNLAKSLIEKYPGKFGKDFGKNKEELNKIITLESKKIRNLVAGYLVHLISKLERPGREIPFQVKHPSDRRGRRTRRR